MCVSVLIYAPPISHIRSPSGGGVNLASFKLSIIIKLFRKIRGWFLVMMVPLNLLR